MLRDVERGVGVLQQISIANSESPAHQLLQEERREKKKKQREMVIKISISASPFQNKAELTAKTQWQNVTQMLMIARVIDSAMLINQTPRKKKKRKKDLNVCLCTFGSPVDFLAEVTRLASRNKDNSGNVEGEVNDSDDDVDSKQDNELLDIFFVVLR
jgi:hypothetical protein